MGRINRETVVAVSLLVFCGVFYWASLHVEDMGYETIGSEIWPQLILAVLFVLSLGYLFQALRDGDHEAGPGGGFKGWLGRYRSALSCYGLFLIFLLTLPWLGMLLGGTFFVFAVLTVLGERTVRHHLIHAGIAVGSISFMWAVFTFGLRVILPQGEILRIW
jgi:putative tricarboxylic transport membrane protein